MIKTPKATVTLLEEGFIRIKIDEGVEMTRTDMLDINAAKNKLAGDKPYLVVFVAPKDGSITSEARAVSASREVYKNAIAKAIVTPNLAQRMVGSFFIKFNRPPAPTKLFSIEKDAIQWLKQMKIADGALINKKTGKNGR